MYFYFKFFRDFVPQNLHHPANQTVLIFTEKNISYYAIIIIFCGSSTAKIHLMPDKIHLINSLMAPDACKIRRVYKVLQITCESLMWKFPVR